MIERVAPDVDVVIPTAGRPSLGELLEALARGGRPAARILIVDDRREVATPLLPDGAPATIAERVEILRGSAAGPAAARNVGWRAASAAWVVFLDDDVVPDGEWSDRLRQDLDGLTDHVAGSQGRVRVPLPNGRGPTDWERNVAGLERARWATADMAFRRSALVAADGFDERFRRAYREDADLGLRLTGAGWRLVRGERTVMHPVRRADRLVSLRLQAGNADDVLMRALHGSHWRARAGAPAGRLLRHLATSAAGAAGLLALALGRRRLALAAGTGWLAGTLELALARIAPGPRTPDELATMACTSALMPLVASAQWLRGIARRRALTTLRGPAPASPPPAARKPPAASPRPDAVLLDRDGTLVVDVPYNGDPERVSLMPGARDALERLRGAGVRLAVVSNQSGVGRGLVTNDQLTAVNERIEQLLGPVGPWVICPHPPDAGCGCRKPAPGLVLRAAELLDVAPERCAVVGDIGADVEAATAAGARGVLVPTKRTRREETAAAAETAPDLGAAVDLLIGGRA